MWGGGRVILAPRRHLATPAFLVGVGELLASGGSKLRYSQTVYTAQDGPTMKNDVNGAEMEKPWSGMCVTRSITDLWGVCVRVCVCVCMAVCDLIVGDSVAACAPLLAQGGRFVLESLCRCFRL